MTLRIGALTTTCRVPRGHEEGVALVDRIARDRLGREIAARVGPSLDREADIVRLRRLEVRVRISLAELRRGALPDVWATELVRSLHAALARPSDHDTLRRFESRAAYLACMLEAALTGRMHATWQFPELAGRAGQAPSVLVSEVLALAGPNLPDLLAELRPRRMLETALAALEELGLERLLRTLAVMDGEAASLTAAQLIWVAQALAVAGEPVRSGPAPSRRQAIRVWLQLDRTLPARGIWYGISLLLAILEQPALFRGPGRAALADGMPAWCRTALADLAHDRTGQAETALEALRAATPSAATPTAGRPERWLASDFAGVLLLCDTVRRSGSVRSWREAGHPQRTIQAFLAGIAMRALAVPPQPPWEPGQPIDAAAALLAGILAEPDARGVAQVFAQTAPLPLLGGAVPGNWAAALDAAADTLLAAFAARIRGFRGAGRASVARHFLRRPGRILIEDRALRVVLHPSPFAVALRVSGADNAVAAVSWLGDRDVSFVLEGL